MIKSKKTTGVMSFADLQATLQTIAKRSSKENASQVAAVLNAMLDSGVVDSDLELPVISRRRSNDQHDKAKMKHSESLWKKISPKYQGEQSRTNLWIIQTLIHRQVTAKSNILEKFKPHRNKDFNSSVVDQYLVKITVVKLDAKGKPDKIQKPQTKEIRGKAHEVVFGASDFVSSIAVSDSSDMPGIVK